MRIAALTSLLTSASTPLVKSFNTYSRPSFIPPQFSRIMTSNERTTRLYASAGKAALLNCPKLRLHDGTYHPCIGFGTYKVGFVPASASSAAAAGESAGAGAGADDAVKCVSNALDCGYRFLECAQFYGNEDEIGKAVKESGVPREDLFLCSKVWTTTIEEGPEAIRAQLDKTLLELGTDYLDLYLIHWPVPGKHVEAYKTLEELKNEGKLRGIGLSNYAVEDYVELKESGIKIKPSVNQIEINPFLYRKNTITFFEKEGIALQSYRSLRNGKDLDNITLVNISKAHGKTAAQVLGRWCIQKGFIYMPKSVKKERMQENAMVFDFELSEKEIGDLDALTTLESLNAFEDLYRKCVNRDTSKDGTMDGVKMDITVD